METPDGEIPPGAALHPAANAAAQDESVRAQVQSLNV